MTCIHTWIYSPWFSNIYITSCCINCKKLQIFRHIYIQYNPRPSRYNALLFCIHSITLPYITLHFTSLHCITVATLQTFSYGNFLCYYYAMDSITRPFRNVDTPNGSTFSICRSFLVANGAKTGSDGMAWKLKWTVHWLWQSQIVGSDQ